MTIILQIGNSDDKLTQREWHSFTTQLLSIVRYLGGGPNNSTVHFAGCSASNAPWQNYCIVAVVNSLDDLEDRLADLARQFKQDSIALTVGETRMIAPRDGTGGS